MNSSGQISCPLRVFRETKIGACAFYPAVLITPAGQPYNAKRAFKEVLRGPPRAPKLTLCCYTTFKLPRNRFTPENENGPETKRL